MKQDVIQFEILEDGTLSIQTDQISAANHVSADELLHQMYELMGGPVTSEKRSRLGMAHTHAQGHEHHHH